MNKYSLLAEVPPFLLLGLALAFQYLLANYCELPTEQRLIKGL